MYRLIRNFVRRKRLEKYASDIVTGFVPMSEIKSVNVVIDVEEPGFDELKEDILAWGRATGLKVSIYFLSFFDSDCKSVFLFGVRTSYS